MPPKSATIRGGAGIEEIDGLAPECVSPAHCCLGDAAAAMLAGTDQPGTDQPGTVQPGTVRARIAVRPTWVGLLDFAERLPSTLGGVQEVAS